MEVPDWRSQFNRLLGHHSRSNREKWLFSAQWAGACVLAAGLSYAASRTTLPPFASTVVALCTAAGLAVFGFDRNMATFCFTEDAVRKHGLLPWTTWKIALEAIRHMETLSNHWGATVVFRLHDGGIKEVWATDTMLAALGLSRYQG